MFKVDNKDLLMRLCDVFIVNGERIWNIFQVFLLLKLDMLVFVEYFRSVIQIHAKALISRFVIVLYTRCYIVLLSVKRLRPLHFC